MSMGKGIAPKERPCRRLNLGDAEKIRITVAKVFGGVLLLNG